MTRRETSSLRSHPPDTSLQHFGATVRRYRQQRRLSHKALAARMGIGASYISQIELGKRNIAVLMLLRLARALDIPATWLLAELDTHADVPPSVPPSTLDDLQPSNERQEETVTPDVTPPLTPEDQTTRLPLLGVMIRKYRQAQGLFQATLAERTDLSSSSICEIEQGHRSVSVLTLVSIARALGLPVSSLLAPMNPTQAVKGFLPQDTAEE